MQAAPSVESKTGVAVLRLSGRFDAYEEPGVRAWLTENCQAGISRLVIDLEDVNFLDSMALAALVKGMKDCRLENGDLHLCGLQQPVRIIFELTRMDRVFSIFDTESAATLAFEG